MKKNDRGAAKVSTHELQGINVLETIEMQPQFDHEKFLVTSQEFWNLTRDWSQPEFPAQYWIGISGFAVPEFERVESRSRSRSIYRDAILLSLVKV